MDIGKALQVPIVAYSIGFQQDWEDVYFEWKTIREVEEDCCILVRPDRYVAWRSMEMVERRRDSLLSVLCAVLWWKNETH